MSRILTFAYGVLCYAIFCRTRTRDTGEGAPIDLPLAENMLRPLRSALG